MITTVIPISPGWLFKMGMMVPSVAMQMIIMSKIHVTPIKRIFYRSDKNVIF